eukprot:TRINITY_DN51256_c0_g1_i1.p1 TRINITY_DN51256_c0_g1~~TRINITY_DN51256_c0_g1_i1.p1  ORF type:complete len:373 (-),score=66.74 TRINITY_DN51256_c0_g1_i1:121-1164(-)
MAASRIATGGSSRTLLCRGTSTLLLFSTPRRRSSGFGGFCAVASETNGLRRSASFGVSSARLAATTATAATARDVDGFAHAVRLDTGPWQNRLTVVPLLHGRLDGQGSGQAVADAIRETAPQQVLVELCTSRYAEALASAVLRLPSSPPPRVDILGNIHGGLLHREIIPVLIAAREVGASVVPIDRPRAATRNRAAQRLWHPKLLQGLLHYGIFSLRRRDTATLPADAEILRCELDKACPAAHQVLVDERCTFMASQAHAVATRGVDVVLVCSALHASTVAKALEREATAEGVDDLMRLARRTAPVWPLYVVGYAIIPGAVAIYAVVSAWNSIILPALFDEDDNATL